MRFLIDILKLDRYVRFFLDKFDGKLAAVSLGILSHTVLTNEATGATHRLLILISPTEQHLL